MSISAQQLATQQHKGQFRIMDNSPYISHPTRVVEILKKHNVTDQDTLAAAWLHDTVEETSLTCQDIEQQFGKHVAEMVFILTRNVDREKYKERLLQAEQAVQMIKLADTLDNVRTLKNMPLKSIQRKKRDCREFYIPLAEKIFPSLAKELEQELQSL